MNKGEVPRWKRSMCLYASDIEGLHRLGARSSSELMVVGFLMKHRRARACEIIRASESISRSTIDHMATKRLLSRESHPKNPLKNRWFLHPQVEDLVMERYRLE